MVKKTVPTKDIALEKLRIRIRSYDHRILDESVRKIQETIERFGVKFIGPIPLPTEIRRWTVNRSTFKYKDSREQFEFRLHKRLIDVVEPNPQFIEALSGITLPVGVDIEIKT